MADDTEEEILRRLKWENKALQQRVFELEEKVRKGLPPGVPTNAGKDTSVTKLLQSKDERLEKTVAELDKRSQELALANSTLRLQHLILDQDPVAMLAVDSDGRILLFNQACIALLGERFREALHRPVEEGDFGVADPATPQMVRTALRSHLHGSRSLRVRDRKLETSVFPLRKNQNTVGALVKISVGPA